MSTEGQHDFDAHESFIVYKCLLTKRCDAKKQLMCLETSFSSFLTELIPKSLPVLSTEPVLR